MGNCKCVCILTGGFQPLENNYFGICLLTAKDFFKHEPSRIYKMWLELSWFLLLDIFAQKKTPFQPSVQPKLQPELEGSRYGDIDRWINALKLVSSFL